MAGKKHSRAKRRQQIVSYSEAARLLGRHRSTITRAVQHGKLISARGGRGLDLAHPVNRAFFAAHRAGGASAGGEQSPGRTAALLRLLAARYNLRREKFMHRMGTLMAADLVDVANGATHGELIRRLQGIPARFVAEKAPSAGHWLAGQVERAVKGAKAAGLRAVEGWRWGATTEGLPELRGGEDYDTLKALLALAESNVLDLRRAELAGALIPLERARQRFGTAAAGVSTYALTLPRAMDGRLRAQAMSDGINAARATLRSEISYRLGGLAEAFGVKNGKGRNHGTGRQKKTVQAHARAGAGEHHARGGAGPRRGTAGRAQAAAAPRTS